MSYLDVHDLLLFTEAFPKFQALLSAPKLWIDTDLQRVLWINYELLDIIDKNAGQVRNLALNSPNYLLTNREDLRAVMCKMPNIKYLDVSMCNLMENMNFLLSMTNLKHLVVDCLSILTTDSFLQFLPHCTSLQTLSMKGNSFLTMTEVTDICCNLINLRFLDTMGTCDFTPDNVTQILTACPNLHTFLFNSFYFSHMYRQWVQLVNVNFPQVTFHYTAYQQLTRFERLLAQEVHFNV